MNFAIDRDLLETNPARAVKRNRRTALTRFLSREEIARLHRVLDRQTRNSSREQADIIRLLLLTGCRRSEIVRLLTGRRSTATNWSSPTARRAPGSFPSIPRPGAFSNAGRAAEARSSFRPREIPPAPQPKSSVLVPRPARGGHRGRSPSRSPPYPCQPRGDERRAGSGRVPAARSFRCAIDAALRPSGRPGNRGRGRAGRSIYRSGHGLVARKRSTAPILLFGAVVWRRSAREPIDATGFCGVKDARRITFRHVPVAEPRSRPCVGESESLAGSGAAGVSLREAVPTVPNHHSLRLEELRSPSRQHRDRRDTYQFSALRLEPRRPVGRRGHPRRG